MARTDPHSYFDAAQPRTVHAELKWDVDFNAKVIRGVAALKLESPSAGTMDLDSRDLLIAKVATSDGRPVPFSVAPADPVLGSRLRLILPQDTEAVVIDYETSPGAVALQWLSPEQTRGRRQPFLFSQCQPHHARTIAPLQDSPVARITYDAEVTVPDGITAVMSAGPQGSRAAAGNKRLFKFHMPQPIPTYLVALAAGDLASREIGPRSRIWAEPEVVEAAAWEFAEIESMIKTAEKLFGPYEWERYDMLVLPPSFPYGGMENPRLTFLTPTLLAGDRSLVTVVAHELAHSWTGNLVTNASVEHFWLNEGFTVWAERRILEALRGAAYASMAQALGLAALRQAMSRFGENSPLTCLVTKLEGINPDDVYSEVPYEKGSLFVTLLEKTAGRDVWDRFIRAYIARFKFTSITTDEFLVFLEHELPGLAKEVQAESWLYKPGLPDNAPLPKSHALDAIQNQARGFSGGRKPSTDEVTRWAPDQLLLFLQGLPRPLPKDECAWLAEELNLPNGRNYEIVVEWLSIALASGYEPAFPAAREVLSEVGRMKYLRPLYQAMASTPRTRAMAREIYAATQNKLHMLSRQVVESTIKEYPPD
jgi:leukotriene A-4 hydrolase/aminopeptidase